MNNRIRKLASVLLLMLAVNVLSANCYMTWNNTYNSEMNRFRSQSAYCNSQSQGSFLCHFENTTINTQVIERAGEAFYNCVMF